MPTADLSVVVELDHPPWDFFIDWWSFGASCPQQIAWAQRGRVRTRLLTEQTCRRHILYLPLVALGSLCGSSGILVQIVCIPLSRSSTIFVIHLSSQSASLWNSYLQALGTPYSWSTSFGWCLELMWSRTGTSQWMVPTCRYLRWRNSRRAWKRFRLSSTGEYYMLLSYMATNSATWLAESCCLDRWLRWAWDRSRSRAARRRLSMSRVWLDKTENLLEA